MSSALSKYEDIIKICKQAVQDIQRITHDPQTERYDRQQQIRRVVTQTDQKIKSYFNVIS